MINNNRINTTTPKFKGYEFIHETFMDFPAKTIDKLEHIDKYSKINLLEASRGNDVLITGQGDSTIEVSASPEAQSPFHLLKMIVGFFADAFNDSEEMPAYEESINNVNALSTRMLEEKLIHAVNKVCIESYERFGNPSKKT